MTILQYIASFVLLLLGSGIAIFNNWVFLCQLRNKHSPSVMPLAGGLLIFCGGYLFPENFLWPWAAFGLVADYGCIPYTTFAIFYLVGENIRYSPKKRLLSLKYIAPKVTGSLHLYPKSRCVHEWAETEGMSSGSMIMDVINYIPNETIQLSLEKINITIEKNNSQWKVTKEGGWPDLMHSILESSITE